ncbi:MAG: serine/threonine-protein kinase PknK, partial [Chloroflexota bacterium]
MISLPGYQVSELLYESSASWVFRAVRRSDQLQVILKLVKSPQPSPEELAQMSNEYEIARQMDLPGVIKVLELVDHGLVFEDFGGEALSRLYPNRCLALVDFLKLAIDITQALAYIHARHVIHKDINPSNLVFNPRTGQVKIIDFGIATFLSTEKQFFCNPNILEGTLPYISPEQTGRINRAVDLRTDLYSLGVTFYELLAGVQPFKGQDAISLIHEHIAVMPAALKELRPDLPLPLTKMVHKLMAKNAEERYQSCYGLQFDLEECLARFQAGGSIQDFDLGCSDFSDQFHLPQKLYGRDQEVASLLSAFERTASGTAHNELVLISGAAGVGKTSLVQEVYKPLTRQHGYYISGKFDQLHRNIPYHALIQAFHGLVQQLLGENADQISAWKSALLAALGDNAQLILDLIPELGLIIGPQPAVFELPPAQAKNRYRLVMQNFIGVFPSLQHPLVLFLDDLQWSDAASLELLEYLITAVDQRYLFIIGAYRNNETHAEHPLGLAIRRIEQAAGVVQTIAIDHLALADISCFVSDTFHVSLENARPLAQLVQSKTDGNPFFINEFLKTLVSRELITFTQRRGWHWDLDQLLVQQITDNVVDLLASRIQGLSQPAQRALEMAACLGSQFDLQTLAGIAGTSTPLMANLLWEAVRANLIIPLNDAYKLARLSGPDVSNTQPVECMFAHDRIRQALYSMIPNPQRSVVHQQVGQYLLQNTPPEKQAEKIFDIVNQFNLAAKDQNMPLEKQHLAGLNLLAGRQAKKSAAFKPAFSYFRAGLDLLGSNGWQDQYDLTLELTQECLDVAYACAFLDQCQVLLGDIFSKAGPLLHKIAAYQVKIKILVAENKPLQALELALEVLKQLGVELPLHPVRSDIRLGLEKVQLSLAGRPVEELVDLPEMRDPFKLAAMQILTSSTVAAINSVPELYSLISFERVNLSIHYGNTQMSPAAYGSYGLYLCGIGQIDQGYSFGRLALNLVEKINALPYKSRTWVTAYTFTIHWKEPLRNILEPLLDAFATGLQTGDIEFSTGALVAYSHTDIFCGTPLAVLQEHFTVHIAAVRQLMHRRNLLVIEMHMQLVQNLCQPWPSSDKISGQFFDEDQNLLLFQQANDQFSLFHLYFYKAMLGYLFSQFERALENLDMAEKYLDSVRAEYIYALFHLYHSLVCLAVHPSRAADQQVLILERVAANQEKLKTWAEYNPANHLNKYALVDAEYARILGQGGAARETYDRAIALAHQNHFLQEEALACELAAKFYLERGQPSLGVVYLLDAHRAYQQWGSTAK